MSSRPPFPEVGSTVGPNGQYFCLGRLGRGTFCSIHKCINLGYFHNKNKNGSGEKNADAAGSLRIVAAKVELSDFTNSGLLDTEAAVLQHLSNNMPRSMIPVYCDLVNAKTNMPSNSSGEHNSSNLMSPQAASSSQPPPPSSSCMSAIVMEYLDGEDMHQLRDRHCQALLQKEQAKMKQAQQTAQNNNNTNSALQMSMNFKQKEHQFRRLSIEDAVYLCADVIIPLLKNMHRCGMIHRDVKPSNCVRTSRRDNKDTHSNNNDGKNSQRRFKIVDFGLSKSFVVHKGSSFADIRHPWETPDDSNNTTHNDLPNKVWHIPPGLLAASKKDDKTQKIEGYLRKERLDAEFRGTSMYASLRVHQLRDYCRRDDVWSCIYVFCDLVSGGLPWMAYAADKKREKCQFMKEWIIGERESLDENKDNGDDGKDDNNSKKHHVDEMLKGAEYHWARHKRETILQKARDSSGSNDVDPNKLPPLIPPLPMSKDEGKIQALKEAFDHVAKLEFQDEPDYELIQKCFRRFLPSSSPRDEYKEEYDIPSLDWKQPDRKEMDKKRWERKTGKAKEEDTTVKLLRPTLMFQDVLDLDPLKEDVLEEAEDEKLLMEKTENVAAAAGMNGSGGAGENSNASGAGGNSNTEAGNLSRLPLPLQYRLAQVEYNAANHKTIPIHLAFRDWMILATSLVYDTWDSNKYESVKTASGSSSGNRANEDGYCREFYLQLMEQCLKAAEPFNMFCSRDCFYYPIEAQNGELNGNNGDGKFSQRRKKRKISVELVGLDNRDVTVKNASAESSLLAFSKVVCALRALIEIEQSRAFAPPPALAFGN